MVAAAAYLRRKELGLCTTCGKERPIETKVSCQKCIDRNKNRKLSLISNGLCGNCGRNKSVHGKTKCQKCLDNQKNNRISLISNGLCGNCGKYPLVNNSYCISCRDRTNLHIRNRKRANINKGMCACGGLIVSGTRCEKCRMSAKKKNEKISSQGLCLWCRKLVVGKKYCTDCAEIFRVRQIESRRKVKIIILKHYGCKCELCGINNPNVLTIDHINNDGRKHRIKIGNGTTSGDLIYRDLIKNKFPDNVRLLCWKCQKITYNEYVRNKASTESRAINRRKNSAKMRLSAINACGGPVCKHCGDVDVRGLVLDHIDGNGKKHRASLAGDKAQEMYKCAIKHPEKFQVLCANCNWIKRSVNGENRK